MGLTATKSLRLEDAGLVKLFSKERQLWRTLAENAYDYVSGGLKDSGEPVRPDDLIAPLIPVLEVTAELRDFLAEKSLRQKYWNQYFAELMVDRLWNELQEEEDDEEEDDD
jgi:hypothetical protein